MSNDRVKAFFASASVVKPPIYSLSLEAMEQILEMLAEKDKSIVELEADCADMAEDIMAQAAAQHSDGHGGIHPALLANYLQDISTARKYSESNGVKGE